MCKDYEQNLWWPLFESLMWQEWHSHPWDLLGSGALCEWLMWVTGLQSRWWCTAVLATCYKSPASCFSSAVQAALQGLSTNLINYYSLFNSLRLCCAVLRQGRTIIEMAVFGRGKVFWATMRIKLPSSCFFDVYSQTDVGAVPFGTASGSSGSNCKGLLCGSTRKRETPF